MSLRYLFFSVVELQQRHDRLLALHDANELSLRDFVAHHDFLAQLTRAIHAEGEAMKRAFLGASAQAQRWSTKGSNRVGQFDAKCRGIMRRESQHNKEVQMAQFEVEWLHNSPAWGKAMEFLDEHWIK